MFNRHAGKIEMSGLYLMIQSILIIILVTCSGKRENYVFFALVFFFFILTWIDSSIIMSTVQ